jgi:hypothetical protein
VTLKDGHYYRAMSELYPMAGGVQRAAASSYRGLRGHMATPESLEEAKLIGRVVQGSTRNNGSSRTINWDSSSGVAGAAVGDYGRVWVPITATGRFRTSSGNDVAVGTARVFQQNCTLADAIGSHACSLEALTCV